MNLVCLGLEGVLIPEIWKAVAESTGIEALAQTTREVPNYRKLMEQRIEILDRAALSLRDLQQIIRRVKPLPGAIEFLYWLRRETRVIILTDAFRELIMPLMYSLEFPTLFCHHLTTDLHGKITGYHLRQEEQKTRAVKAFRELNFQVVAVGDSYNDLGMLQAAHFGILFCPSERIESEKWPYPVVSDHEQLQAKIETLL